MTNPDSFLGPRRAELEARLFALLLALVGSASCSTAAKDETTVSATTDVAAPSAGFSWFAIRPASEAEPEQYPAKLLQTGDSGAVVATALQARILSISVKPGDTVAKGAEVAKVLMPEIDSALATLIPAQRSLEVLQERRRQLAGLESDGLVRGADIAALELELARHRGDILRSNAVLAGAGVTRGGPIVLRSPIAGVVVEVSAIPGEWRRPEDEPIARVRVRSGQRIEARLPHPTIATARFSLLAAGRDVPLVMVNQLPASGGVGYLAWFEARPGAEMPSASEARVSIRDSEAPDAWLVQSRSVGVDDQGHYVVAKARADASPEIIRLELVRSSNSQAIVRASFASGALVASDPARARTELEGGRTQ